MGFINQLITGGPHIAGGGPALLRERAPGGRQRWTPLDHLGSQLPDGLPADRGREHGLRRGRKLGPSGVPSGKLT